MFNSFPTVSAPSLSVFMYNFGIFLLQLEEIKSRGSSCSCWQLTLQFLMRETGRREALCRRGEITNVIIYTLAFSFILAANQPKYMDSNTHDGVSEIRGKNLYCYGPVAVHYSFALIN